MEAHGVVLPMDEPNLALLDVRTDADPVVRRTDLPGSIGSGYATGSGGGAGTDPVDDLLRSAPEGRYPTVDAGAPPAPRHARRPPGPS